MLLDRAARDHPTLDGLVVGGRHWSWSSVRDLVDRAAARLADRGAEPGDRVAVVAPPGPAATIALFACWRLGAVAVPLDPTLRADVVAERLAVVAPALVVADLDALDPVQLARTRLVGCRSVLVTDHARWGDAGDRAVALLATAVGRRRRPGRDDDVASFDALLDAGPALVRQASVEPGTPAAIVWTAGTTARARPVVLTHGNLLANAVQVREWVVDVRDGREVALAGTPPWRGDGLAVALLAPVLAAATVVLVRDLTPAAVARAVARTRATLVIGPPSLFEQLVPLTERHDLGSIRVALSVGAPLVADVARRFEDALPASRLRQAYGQTECTAVALAAPVYGDVDRGPVALPVTDTVAVVATLEDPTVLAERGTIGQLLVAGPQVTAGVWAGPDRPTTRVGPWLATGDAASQGDGVFTLHGRVAHLVATQAGLVVPSRVERALRQHPRIADAVVLATVPTAGRAGRDVELVAIVEPTGRRRPTLRRVLDHLGPLVAAHELPDRVIVERRLPRTATGAPDRHLLRARHGLARPRPSGDATRPSTPSTGTGPSDPTAVLRAREVHG